MFSAQAQDDEAAESYLEKVVTSDQGLDVRPARLLFPAYAEQVARELGEAVALGVSEAL